MKAKAEFIDPREAGYRPPSVPQPMFNEDALARAEKTLEAMSGSFEKWLDADVAKLQAARVEGMQQGWTDAALEAVWRAAHDLKGMGDTYGYPLVTQLAASLCRLLETSEGKRTARGNPELVAAHVDGLRAAVRDKIASDANPTGRALIQALEAHVSGLGIATR